MLDREEYEARAKRLEDCATTDVATLAGDVRTLAAAHAEALDDRDAARAQLAVAERERDEARAARIGMWRCDCCGEGVEPGELPPAPWRWTGDAWQHRCQHLHPTEGYQSSTFFPWTGETVAAMRADYAEALRCERANIDARIAAAEMARDVAWVRACEEQSGGGYAIAQALCLFASQGFAVCRAAGALRERNASTDADIAAAIRAAKGE